MREKLIELLKDTRANAAWHHWGYEESADHLIANDVVPVVRCKDCKHYMEYPLNKVDKRMCCYVHILTPHFMPEDGFCSYGERKDNGR